MEIDFDKLKNKEYPKDLEDYYTEVKLSNESRAKTNLKYEYDEIHNILRVDKNRDVLFKLKKSINFPEDVKTKQDVDQYIYNSQTCISLDYDKSVAIIDGIEIPLENFVLDKTGESGKFEYKLCPVEFDENDFIKWTLKYKISEKEINLVRVANSKSAYTKKYEYLSQHLRVTIFISKTDDIKITVGTRFEDKVNLELLLESLAIQIAFLEKELSINGVELSKIDSSTKPGDEEKIIRIKEMFNFWHNVRLLEKELKTEFIIELPLDDETLQNLEKLIISFVYREVYRETYKINNINLKFNSIDEMYSSIDEIKKNGNSSIHWREPQDYNILGSTLNIYKYFGAFNFEVYSIIPDEETTTLQIKLKEKNDDKMIIVSKFILENEVIQNLSQVDTPKYWMEYRDRIKSSNL
ncbi:hypothetical protein N7L96_12470 [Mammaliicoccus sciuri]|uniref:hypothetical protein n=1 Tax=Mammaliicoccus sciuri TaxID=1296 RepID=UPI00233FADC5|nr:hypothetical protein [Mammaliicoccus sciuri]MDC5695398.1 hypothetical protein [Mammaliicoccus sciuri]